MVEDNGDDDYGEISYFRQVRDVLEEVLRDMCRRVQESSSITYLASGIIQIYLQHYRQYQRVLKKVGNMLFLQIVVSPVLISIMLAPLTDVYKLKELKCFMWKKLYILCVKTYDLQVLLLKTP